MRKLTLAAAALLLLLSACSDKEPSEGANHGGKKAVAAEKPAGQPAKELPYKFPLTGIGSEKPTDGRAFAVMVNNFPKARPQSGLQKADIVYELLAEGDITRFLAVFQSEKPVTVGPVRSARDYYIELAKGLDSIFIAHGYSSEAEAILKSGSIDNLNGMQYDGSLFKRVSFRKAPHNSYITYKNMVKGAEKNHFDQGITPKAFTFLTEKEAANIQGRDAKAVSVAYFSNDIYSSVYEYDSALGKYKRYSNGELTADLDTKEPVLLDNVFILETKHETQADGLRNIDLKSGGNGYLLQKGKVTEVEWENVDGRLVPVKNGREAGLVPGKTWVNVVPDKPGLSGSVSFKEK